MDLLHLCLVAAIFTTGSLAIPYSPECRALDDMIEKVSSPLPVGGQLVCNKSVECTGLTCALTYESQTTYMKLDIHHCESPPSMEFRMFTSDGTYNFEKTVTHNDRFEILDLSSIPGLDSLASFMHVYIRTDFQKVEDGLLIGVNLEAGLSEDIIAYDQPIIEDHFVPTPPCRNGPSLPPEYRVEQCKHMDGLMEDLPYQDELDCTKDDSCMGITCAGTISDLDVHTNMEINNCDDPVSLTVFVDSGNLTYPWQHTFTGSETVMVNDIHYYWNGFPVVVRIEVEMEPPEDGYMLTSLTFIGCADTLFGMVCPESATVKILDNSEVPVPPCQGGSPTLPPPPPPPHHFPTYPTPAPHSECKALDDMIKQLIKPTEDDHMISCARNNNCTGINCTAAYLGDDYETYFGVHHCQVPVDIVIAINSNSQNIHFQRTFTHGDTVPISGLNTQLPYLGNIQIYLQVEMTKEEHDLILSIYLLFGKTLPGDVALLPKIPLVQDEDIPLPTCDGSTRPPPPPPPPPGGTGSYPPQPGRGTGKPMNPSKPPGGKQDKLHGKHAGASPHTTSVAVGVVVAVVVVFGVIAAVVLLRRYRCLKYGGTTVILDSKSQSTSII